jgi:hypothetical protein
MDLAPSWFDVDVVEDLIRLAAGGDVPRHTAQWLELYADGLLRPRR